MFDSSRRLGNADPRNPLPMPKCRNKFGFLVGCLLIADPHSTVDDHRPTRFGVIAEDADAVLAEAKVHGVGTLRDEPTCLALPDGIVIKVAQAALGAVGSILAVKTRPEQDTADAQAARRAILR